jgi:hypothetical protein
VSDLEQIVVEIDKTSAPLISGLMEEISESTKGHIDYVFWRVIQLFFIVCGVGIVFFAIYCWQKGKTSGSGNKPNIPTRPAGISILKLSRSVN